MIEVIRVYRLRCGNCSYTATALHEESCRTSMLEHLIAVHSGHERDPEK